MADVAGHRHLIAHVLAEVKLTVDADADELEILDTLRSTGNWADWELLDAAVVTELRRADNVVAGTPA